MMSFERHRKSIFRWIRRGPVGDRVGVHRLDEFPAGYSLAGCAPALPASASPTGFQYAIGSSCRSRSFQRTANSVLTGCLSTGGRRSSAFSPHFQLHNCAAPEASIIRDDVREIVSDLLREDQYRRVRNDEGPLRQADFTTDEERKRLVNRSS